MVALHTIRLAWPASRTTGLLLLLACVAASAGVLQYYLAHHTLSFVLGLLALPFTLRKGEGRFGYRYAAAALLVMGAAYLMPVSTLLYFSTGFAVFFLLQALALEPRFLSCAVLVFMSPIFQYIAGVFSFPIRLKLTAWAAQLFAWTGSAVTARGNSLFLNQTEFSVDPACMGLNMLAASLLLGLLFLGFYQKKYGREVRWWMVLLFLLAVVGCNIGGNLLRIVLLVQFALLPQTLLHEVVGLLCLLAYVLLPAACLARWAVRKTGTALQEPATDGSVRRSRLWTSFLLLLFLVCLSGRVAGVDTYARFTNTGVQQVPGYRSTVSAPGILQLRNERALVYVKYSRGFYDSEHNPTLCWSGSGYAFSRIEEQRIGGQPVYTALLTNGKDRLYTAWWYGNGQHNTTDQLAWRWNMLRGSRPYAVINVTAATGEALVLETERILRQQTLSPLFHRM